MTIGRVSSLVDHHGVRGCRLSPRRLLAVPFSDLPSKRIPSSCYASLAGRPGEDDEELTFALLEEGDLDEVSTLLTANLGLATIILPENLSDLERRIFGPPTRVWNFLAQSAYIFEAKLGLRLRCGRRLIEARLDDNQEMECVNGLCPKRESLVVVVRGSSSGKIVAAAELSSQPPDGQLPTNFPELYVRPRGQAFLPYLCNVAVDKGVRRRGIARRLVFLCEQISRYGRPPTSSTPSFVLPCSRLHGWVAPQ